MKQNWLLYLWIGAIVLWIGFEIFDWNRKNKE